MATSLTWKELLSHASVLLALLVCLALAEETLSPCNANASRNNIGVCVCNAGFVGDGIVTCGVTNSISIPLSTDPDSPTSAIVNLPMITSSSTNLAITSVTSTNTQFVLYQSPDGSSQGAAISMTGSGPWAITNPIGAIFMQLGPSAPAGTFTIAFSYSAQGLSISDAVTVSTYTACSGLDDLAVTQYGYTTAPKLGAVNLSWLSSTYQVAFDVTAAYEHDNAIVIVDTVEFNSTGGNVRLRPAGSCSARAAVPATTPFHALFQAAPTATSPNALSGQYLAYPDSSPTDWITTAVNCSSVVYRRTFALSELSSCNNVQRSTATDPITGATMVTYAGSIYIHTLQPGDDSARDESQGYAKFTQTFPWEVNVYTESEALVQFTTESKRIHIVVRDFELQGSDMLLQIETQTQSQGVDSPAVLLSDGTGNTALIVPNPAASAAAGNAPCLNNGESDICVQQWVYNKPSWADSDNLVYNFVWGVYGTNDTDQLTVPVSLALRINDVQMTVGKLGELTLNLYNDPSDAEQGTANNKAFSYPWHVNERIYVRGDVMLNPSDAARFSLAYTQVWVCYSPVLGYDINLASGGCLDPVVGDASRVQLIANGAVQTGGAAAGFRATTNTVTDGAASIAAGLSFDAFPLTSQPQVYTIHARVLVSFNGRKREINILGLREANSPAASTRLMIFPDAHDAKATEQAHGQSVATPTPKLSSKNTTTTLIVIVTVTVVAVLGLMTAVVVLLALLGRRQRLSVTSAASVVVDSGTVALVTTEEQDLSIV